jgi:tRNA (adenine22-N1)-methyltransferase
LLTGRLLSIYNKIPSCNIVCDIGTDHGYIPIELIVNRKCSKVIASDIVKGPLRVAEKNIKKFNLQDKIELRHGNGIMPISLWEIDVVVIAGMGGELIGRILSDSFEKAKKANLIILQPMNRVEELRKYLYKSGFDILDEELASECGKIYNIILTKYDGISREKIPFLTYIGEMLLKRRTPLFERYISKMLKRLKKELTGIEKSKTYNEEEGNKIKSLIGDVEGLL